MDKADIIERNEGGNHNVCRCKTCGELFKAGGNMFWQNHFYCSIGCGNKANECKSCGGNRNFCECKNGW